MSVSPLLALLDVATPGAQLLCDSRLSLTLLDVRHNPLSAAARGRLRERFGAVVLFG